MPKDKNQSIEIYILEKGVELRIHFQSEKEKASACSYILTLQEQREPDKSSLDVSDHWPQDKFCLTDEQCQTFEQFMGSANKQMRSRR